MSRRILNGIQNLRCEISRSRKSNEKFPKEYVINYLNRTRNSVRNPRVRAMRKSWKTLYETLGMKKNSIRRRTTFEVLDLGLVRGLTFV